MKQDYTLDFYLHGGGDNPAWREATLGRFVGACGVGTGRPLALILAVEEEGEREENWIAYRDIFGRVIGPDGALQPLFVTPGNPLTIDRLRGVAAGGVFVCGGMTPYYQASLCREPGWMGYLVENELPYGGTSSGAAIAAEHAIVGGWQVERGGRPRQFVFSGAGEGLDELTVRPGLGVTPFAVEVHAGQWGTLGRLVHAVEQGMAAEGWAIDENTMLIRENGVLSVVGHGQAYRVWLNDRGNVGVDVLVGA